MLFRIVCLLFVCFSSTFAVDNLVTQIRLSRNERDQLGLREVQIGTLINAFGTLLMTESNSPDNPVRGSQFVGLSNQGVTSTTFDFEYFGETFGNLNVRNIYFDIILD